MKSRILLFTFSILSIVVLLSSCEDTRLDAVVDDKIYALKPDYDEVEVFNWGDFDYSVAVVKSGAGKQSSDVEIVIDESYLAEYNEKNGTSYELLPASCYTLHTNKLSLSKDGYMGEFPMTFKAQAIIDLQGENNVKHVLPYRIEVKNAEIAASTDRLYTIISPRVKEPFLVFKNPGKTLGTTTLTPESNKVISLSSTIKTVYHNKWNLTYELSIEPKAIDDYNSSVDEGELKFKLLPEAAYKLLPETFKVKEKLNEGNFEYELYKEGLFKDGKHQFGNYMIPVRISSASHHKVDPGNKSLQLIAVAYQAEYLDRNDWEVIEFSSQEPGDGGTGGASDVLDGNEDTFWHSQWKDPAGTGIPPLPHHIIIDMKKDYDVMVLEVVRRAYNTDTKKVVFELSADNVKYEQVTSMDFGATSNPTRTMSNDIATKRVRYLKCIVTESNNIPHISIAEIKVKGIVVE